MFMKYGTAMCKDLQQLRSDITAPVFVLTELDECQMLFDANCKPYMYTACRGMQEIGIPLPSAKYIFLNSAENPEFGALYDDGFPIEFTSLDKDHDMYYRNVDFWDGVKANDEYWQHVNAQYNKEVIILGVDNIKDYDYGVNEDGNFVVVQNKTVTEYTPKEFVAFMEADCKEY